jgi:hypothetical protein
VALPLVLMAGCGSAAGSGSTSTSSSPAAPKDFPAAFADLNADVTKRIGEAAGGSSAATACADVAGAPLDGWLDTLRAAPDAAVRPINAYLVRVQVALAACQDGTYTTAALDAITARADAVRQAATPPTPTASPSDSASPDASASAAAMTSSLMRFGAAALTQLCPYAAAALAPARRDNKDFAYEVNKLTALPYDATQADYVANEAAIRAMTPCNAAQAKYQQLSITMLGWLAAEKACQTEFYDGATTLGDVNLWLSCINPVYAGELPAIRAQSDAYADASTADCTAGYQPPAIEASPGMALARTVTVGGTVIEGYHAVKDVVELGGLAKHGVKLLMERELTGSDVHEYATKVTVKIGEMATDAAVDEVRDRLGKLTIAPGSATVPDADTKVSVEVPGSGTGVKPVTAYNGVTIKK